MRRSVGTRYFFQPCLIVFIGAILATANGDQGQAKLLQKGWREASRLRINLAYETFLQASASREALFGQAVTLLNIQPKTEGNIEAAADLFEKLIQANADDDSGIASRYYLARVEQLHRRKPNLPKAEKLFAELIQSHPKHPLAQMAVIKLSMVQIFTSESLSEQTRCFEDAEKRGLPLRLPAAQRDFHLMMADAYALLDVSQAKSLVHLLSAEKTNMTTGKIQADLLVRIAELARRLGQSGRADEYERKFLAQFPRDRRAYSLRKRQEARR